ncbi:MAG: hypothetical protein JWN94_510 [Betaproteobacteria bacterium]|nr:hypothetical protein [Betaproteobacteria bacterium]
MTLGRLFLLAVLIAGVVQYWNHHKPIASAAGITASPGRDWNAYGYKITPLEKFAFSARVLRAEHYSMDRESQLAPVDLALGWGPMAKESVIDKVSITQSHRFYYWRVDDFPIPRREIEINSANMHMIPANAEVERALRSIHSGQSVTFSGYLIEARAPDGWRWRSSLTRDDTGAGACELVWVEQIAAR